MLLPMALAVVGIICSIIGSLLVKTREDAAQSIVVEVRRQFKEIPGIMDYKADPDYASCVSLCTKGALHEMIAPAILAIAVPIATGLVLENDINLMQVSKWVDFSIGSCYTK